MGTTFEIILSFTGTFFEIDSILVIPGIYYHIIFLDYTRRKAIRIY